MNFLNSLGGLLIAFIFYIVITNKIETENCKKGKHISEKYSKNYMYKVWKAEKVIEEKEKWRLYKWGKNSPYSGVLIKEEYHICSNCGTILSPTKYVVVEGYDSVTMNTEKYVTFVEKGKVSW